MFELDFSIRDVFTCKKVTPTEVQSDCECTKRKYDTHTNDDAGLPDNKQGVDTPDNIKRLRLEIDEAFEKDNMLVDEGASELLFVPDESNDRPKTPPELLALRELIGGEFVNVTPELTVAQEVQIDRTKMVEDPFKHAGLFSEYGGIKGWMKLYGKR